MNKCELLRHKKLVAYEHHFTDSVSGKMVYKGVCQCGVLQMTNRPNSWFGFRVVLGMVQG